MRDARPWTHAALFGALWGAAEITLGTLLSVGRVPMFGTTMASIGVLCMVTARRLQPAVGSTVVMGLVVAFLKVCFVGSLALGAVIGILAQALVMELAMSAARSPAAGAVIGGALALATAPAQRLLLALLVVGPEGAVALDKALRRIAGSFGWHGPASLVLVAWLVGLTAFLGAIVGAFSWRVAGRVCNRVRGRA